MTQRVFVDANVINDIYDQNRRFHEPSYQCLEYCLANNMPLVTSCDIVTTVYYITTKSKNAQDALAALAEVNGIFEIVPFNNPLLGEAIRLMQQDTDYRDLEDTLQFVMAKQAGCEFILSNDAGFVAKGLPLFSSESFIKQFT